MNPEKFKPETGQQVERAGKNDKKKMEEKELASKDISQEFLTMNRDDFYRFLRSQRN